MPADIIAFPAAHPLAYVRVHGEHGGVHVASLVHYEKHLAARIEAPNCTSRLVCECTTRVNEGRLTTAAITCGRCAPIAARYPMHDVTSSVIASAIA